MSASTAIFSEFKEATLGTEKAIKAVIATHCENMKEYITNPDRRAKDYGVIANHCENMKEHIIPSTNIDTGADISTHNTSKISAAPHASLFGQRRITMKVLYPPNKEKAPRICFKIPAEILAESWNKKRPLEPVATDSEIPQKRLKNH